MSLYSMKQKLNMMLDKKQTLEGNKVNNLNKFKVEKDNVFEKPRIQLN